MRGDIVRRAMFAATCLLSSAMLAITLGPALEARADPLNADPSVGNELSLPWPTLGLPGEITLVGANNNQDFKLPVPPGFEVRRLRGLIHAPVDFGAGFVEIDDAKGTLLATVDLPAVTPSQAVVPFDVDVSTAQVAESTVGLSFTVREGRIPPDQRCGLGERVVISDLAAVLTGNEPAPTTVASFFPPVLERLTIYTPSDANAAEQQAVLALSSAVAKNYRPQPTAISVVKQPRRAAPQPAAQFSRAVVVEDGDAGIDVVNAGRSNVYLRLTGRGDQLTDQVSLVVNRLQSLVQIPDARVDKGGTTASPAADELSFDQLGLKGSSSVLRASTLTVGFDRAVLGRGRVDGLKVHLLASHTPIASLDSATLMVNLNGQSVYTTPLTESGRVDAVFDVPDSFLGQRINLDFALTFSPRQLCSPTIAPMTFQLDPRSTVTVHRGGQAPGGFAAVPSELSPEFLVAFDGSDPNQLDYATRVVADVARLTETPLMPRVVDVMSAADSHTPALIVANSTTLKRTSMQPPIGGERSDVEVGLADELRANIAGGLGSIQVFADQPRDRTVILITTSGAWSLVEPVLGYVDQLPDGWSSLVGNVAAAGADGAVSNLSIGPADTTARSPAAGRDWAPWIATGAALVVLAAVGLAILFRRRRRRS